MGNKAFIIILVLIVGGGIAAALVFGSDSELRERLGFEQEDFGTQHVSAAQSTYGGESEPPTSGDHAQPVDKGVYTSELPDINTIHNLEHGYIYVTYQPDLPQVAIDQMRNLFFAPYSNADFAPTKVIMAPRAANGSPIILSSWTRSLTFTDFDEQQMIDYYLGNVSKSPEPTAQ